MVKKYVMQQLISLNKQTVMPDEIIISDDCSTDHTVDIINKFSASSNFTVNLAVNNTNNGVCNNFRKLLLSTDSCNVMLCDQDDVWLKDKIKFSIDKIKELEYLYGTDMPCLVHSDMSLIDKSGAEISNSFWQYQNLFPEISLKLNRTLAQNVATGCTMIFNRAMLKIAQKMPANGPLMHDWWILLACHAVGGKVAYLVEPTMQYRQHNLNVVGAKKWNFINSSLKILNIEKIKKQLVATQNQAACLLDCYSDFMTKENRELISRFSKLDSQTWLEKRLWMFKNDIKKSGWQRTLGLYLYV